MEGATREKTRFLIIPKMIKNEIRWMERATWKEEYKRRTKEVGVVPRWKARYWIDK